jgi:plastocyanin
MKHLRTLLLLAAGLTVAALLAVACGDDDEADTGGEATTRAAATPEEEENGSPAAGDSVELELTAENTSYDQSELTAPAGADVLLIFDNDDDGVQHNFSLYESEEATEALFEGEIVTGIVEGVEYEFRAPEDPGTYHFHCDVHPTQMTGDFIVE